MDNEKAPVKNLDALEGLKLSKFFDPPLGRLNVKLLKGLILISSFFALFSTMGQLFLEYSSAKNQVKQSIDLIETVSLPSMSEALWRLDETQLNTKIRSLLTHPDIASVELSDSNGLRDSYIAKRDTDYTIHRQYEFAVLRPGALDSQDVIGHLKISVTFDNIQSVLWDKAFFILGIQLLKSMIVCSLFFLLIQYMVTDRIRSIVEHISNTTIHRLRHPLKLELKNIPFSFQPDELDDVVASMNAMQSRLEHEISEVERLRSAARKNEESLKATFSAMTEAVLTTDESGNIRDMNVAAETLFETTTADCLGKNHTVLFNTGSETAIELAPRSGHTFSMSFLTPSGDKRDIVATVTDSLSGAGAATGKLFIICDVTTENSLRERAFHNDKLRLLGQVSGGVAHDFNNLLTVIRNSTALLGNTDKNGRDFQELLTQISNSTVQGSRLVSTLLSFSRRPSLKYAPIDANAAIRQACEMAKRTTVLHTRIDINLEAKDARIYGDEALLTNTLLNLILNAQQAMPNGGTVTVTTTQLQPARRNGPQRIAIDVKDNGSGIDAEIRKKIFDPFFSTKLAIGGSGLGLASATHSVEDMKGSLTLHETSELGSTFRIIFEVVRDQLAIKRDQPITIGNGERILLVDDELAQRQSLSMMLEHLNYRVETAENGEVAEEFLKKTGYDVDLVIADMVMPVMNGQELIRRIKAADPSFKIMVCSGYWSEDLQSFADHYSNAVVVTKPYDLTELSVALRKLLEGDAVMDRKAAV